MRSLNHPHQLAEHTDREGRGHLDGHQEGHPKNDLDLIWLPWEQDLSIIPSFGKKWEEL